MAVSREEHKVEEEQRARRRQEIEEGSIWQARYFHPGEWHEAERLLAKIGGDSKADETKRIWRWRANT